MNRRTWRLNFTKKLFESEFAAAFETAAMKLKESEDFEDIDEDDELDEEALFEDDELNEAVTDSQMSEEDLKIESLKIATNIAKLMSDVTTEDIITIADKVSDFIRNHEIGGEANSEDNTEEPEEELDFELPSLDGSEAESEEESEEKEEESEE